MKTTFLPFAFLLLSLFPLPLLHAQAPQGIHYQAVARDGNQLFANQSIVIRFTIAAGGQAVYQERHNATTNPYGLFNLAIGTGLPIFGQFSQINWAAGGHTLRVEANMGSGFADLGTSPLLSVPYSLYAAKANMALADLTNVDESAPAIGEVLAWNGFSWVPAPDEFMDADSDPGNELQTLAISGNTISLSRGGGAVSIPVYSGGTGISVAGTLITNTGDTNPNDDLTITSQAAGDVTGLFSAMSVGRIQGQPVAPLAPATGEVLKWDGIQWKAAVDENNIPPWNRVNNDIHYLDGRVGIGTMAPRTAFHVAAGKTVLFGADSTSSGIKMFWSPVRGALRVGGLSSAFSGNFWNPDSLGFYSFSAGLDTRATGFGATALGRETEATAVYALATGYFTDAKANYATAMGYNTAALGLGAMAVNYETQATGNYTFAAGHSAKATGNYTTALGFNTTASGAYSTAMGFQTKATAYAATTIGRFNAGGGSATSWVPTDPIFEVGIGANALNAYNALTVLKNGRVGIATATPEDALHVNGVVRIGTLETIQDGGSFILNVNAALAPLTNGAHSLGSTLYRWNTVYAMNGLISTSDHRDKQAIRDITYGLAEVLQLRPVAFQWKAFPEEGEKLGLIAQEVQQVLPEIVRDTEWQHSEADGQRHPVDAERMGIFYADLIPVLIKAMQEQQAEIEALKARISVLEEE